MNERTNFTQGRGGIARLMSGIGPRIMLSPDDLPGPDEAARKAAEEAAAKKAAEEAAAKKAAEDEAARKAAEEAAAKKAEEEKNLSEADKEKRELLREVMEKKDKLKKFEEDNAKLKSELERFAGIDADEVKKLVEEKKAAEQADLERRGEFDRIKAMMKEAHETETKTLTEQLEAERAKNKELVGTVDKLTIGQSFAGSTFIAEDLVLTPTKARTLYGSHFEIKDGAVVAYDKPAGAENRTMMVNAMGAPLEFDAALRKLVDADPEKDSLLKSKLKPGSASKSQDVKAPPKADGELHGTSRIAAGLAKLTSK